jgi:hypothetical protein
MTIDLDRYPGAMRRLRRTATALLVPGVALAGFGIIWLVLVGMIVAFHDEMKAEAGEDYWLLMSVFITLGVVPSLVAAVLVRLGMLRVRLRRQLRDLAALSRVHGLPGDAAIEQQLGLSAVQRERLLAAAVARGLLPRSPALDPGDPPHPPPGSVFNDTYEVREVLRQGEHGAVYRVRHTRTEQRYALETFVPLAERDAASIHAILQASVAASELDHPGLVRIVDLDATPAGMPFAVTEWLDGELDPARASDPAIKAAVAALREAALDPPAEVASRVFAARDPGGGERLVLLHVGHLAPARH